MNINFENTYFYLPKDFYKESLPIGVSNPRLVFFNEKLSEELKLPNYDSNDLNLIFSGQRILSNSKPIAMAYAGHQFGHFVPQLGDGRAILLGEVRDKSNKLRDIHLKGSGKTYFSRGGDGLAPLGPMLREYIVSEAMNALGVPTTRALALVSTGDLVYRENPQPGAILTRIASSHIRVGTFEFFASRNDLKNLKVLADYVIQRHYPDCITTENPYLDLLKKVICAQAKLMARWMGLGFIHGVMNTDNTTISGETIDYGPCAFMDYYNPEKVFSSIDRGGRYAYKNQPQIAEWNLSVFASCLLPLVLAPSSLNFKGQDDFEAIKKLYTEENIKVVQDEIDKFERIYKFYWLSEMKQKLGLRILSTDTTRSDSSNLDTTKINSLTENDLLDYSFCEDFLNLLQTQNIDFTLGFRTLSELLLQTELVASKKNLELSDSIFESSSFGKLFGPNQEIKTWVKTWFNKLKITNVKTEQIVFSMNLRNPQFIPRNHWIDKAIKDAEIKNDFSLAEKILSLVTSPFQNANMDDLKYSYPPKPGEQITNTFCGT